jgi:rSAM/selenodomain-associated transferase 2
VANGEPHATLFRDSFGSSVLDRSGMKLLFSIVIPARNDAEPLRLTLDHLQRLRRIERAEIIVAAASQKEETENAVSGRAKILWPAKSTRAALMNAGAAVASGDVLFFLHADSFPPLNALVEIEHVLQDHRIVGGAFEHRFKETVWSLRLISWINRRRYFITRNYYGDQGIFVRADIFRSLGGYREMFMEDLDFSRRLKKTGRTRIISLPMITSGRRFLTWGPWRAFLFIVWVLLLYSLRLDTQCYAGYWNTYGGRSVES